MNPLWIFLFGVVLSIVFGPLLLSSNIGGKRTYCYMFFLMTGALCVLGAFVWYIISSI